jgi:excisionase family DNA binding protein
MATDAILLSRKKTAALLAVSVGTVDALVRKGELEPVRIGRRVLFRRDAVERLTLTERQRQALRDTNGELVQ